MLDKKERAQRCIDALKLEYPDAICTIDYEKDYELLFSTRLAAQCTDARVNIVTKTLYKKYPSLEAFAAADIPELENDLRPTGFFRMKARDLKAAARVLLDDYGGKVPDTMEELLKIPGVGRKTANLVLGDIFGKPSYVCDTHCIRITNLLGLTEGKDPAKVEVQLREILPPDEAGAFCHRLVLHGRAVCVARRPSCAACCMKDYCAHAASLEAHE